METRERNLYLSPTRVGAWKLRSCARWHSISGVSLKMLPSFVANLKPARSLALDDDVAVPREQFDLANVTASGVCLF